MVVAERPTQSSKGVVNAGKHMGCGVFHAVTMNADNIRTLMMHTGGIGDFLLACPAIAWLARSGPVTLLGNRDRLQLAVAGGIAAAAHDADAVDFASVFGEASPRLRAFLGNFDRAVVWMRDDDIIARAFAACGLRDTQCHPGLPPEDWSRHASEYYLDRLGAPQDVPCRLQIPARACGVDCILHPGSGSPRKNWPLDRFAAVAEALMRDGMRVAWCVGPAEESLAAPAIGERLPPLSLMALAESIAGAALFIGNDSGITHLAAALGRPTVAVFGPTNPRVWAPRGPHVRVAHDPRWPDTEAVIAAARHMVKTDRAQE